jgi:hypothetical protein
MASWPFSSMPPKRKPKGAAAATKAHSGCKCAGRHRLLDLHNIDATVVSGSQTAAKCASCAQCRGCKIKCEWNHGHDTCSTCIMHGRQAICSTAIAKETGRGNTRSCSLPPVTPVDSAPPSSSSKIPPSQATARKQSYSETKEDGQASTIVMASLRTRQKGLDGQHSSSTSGTTVVTSSSFKTTGMMGTGSLLGTSIAECDEDKGGSDEFECDNGFKV